MEKMTIYLEFLEHPGTGRMAAVSEELPGLLVTGKSVEDVMSQIEPAIRELFEADGKEVTINPLERDDREAGWTDHARRRAELEVA